MMSILSDRWFDIRLMHSEYESLLINMKVCQKAHLLLINNDCQCKGRYFSSYSIPIEFKKLIYSSLSDTFL